MAYTDLPIGSDIVGGVLIIPVGDVNIAAGNLRLRVKAMGGNNAGDVLVNDVPFTVFVPGNTTPDAPTFANFNDTANTVELVPTAGVPMADYRYTLTGDATVYTVDPSGIISVGDVDTTVTAYSIADTGRNQSPNATQVFTATVISYEPETADYFTTVEAIPGATLTLTQKQALSDWVAREKAGGRYVKYNEIKPILGGNAAAHAIDFIAPSGIGLLYEGTWAHSAAGMRITDPISSHAFAVGKTVPSQNSHFIGAYVNDNIDGGYVFGAADGVYTRLGIGGGQQYHNSSNTTLGAVATGSAAGYNILTRTDSAGYKVIINSVVSSFAIASSGAHTAAEIGVGGINGLDLTSTQRRFAFFAAGSGFTEAEALAATASMNTLQTDLGRA